MLKRLGIRSKLLVMLLLVSIGSIVVVSGVSFLRSRQSISDLVTDRLTAQRASLGREVESYFETFEGQAATLAANRMVVEAVLEFGVGWDQLAANTLSAEETAALAQVYQDLNAALPAGAEPLPIDRQLPADPAARFLQHRYIAAAGDGSETGAASGDGTFYGRAHRRYHATFSGFVERFGFYDLLLVDDRTGNVVYSVEKEVDFGSDLSGGAFQNSNLGRLVRDVTDRPTEGRVAFADFEFYRPSGDVPAAFVASPIINPANDEFVGVLALRLPVDRLNALMTGDGDWSDFGDTGEAYLVGDDLRMRSQGRLLAQQPDRYRAQMALVGVDPATVDRIMELRSTVLLQPVDTEAARRALGGETGTELVTDYLGTDVLASYAPLDLPGLRWGIVAKFSRAEASEPIGNLQRDLLVATGVIVLVLTGLAMTLSSVFVRPIEQLIGWTTRIESGDLSGPALRNELDGRDEFGELAASLDRMVATLRDQRGALEAKNAENERLVDSLMPPAIAARLRAGERSIADEYPNVTVIHARLRGFTSLTVGESAERAAEILNDLANTLDAAAERHGIEKIKTVGDSYIAVCGLSVPRLDGRRRAVEFAMELCRSIGMYGQGNHLTLSGSVGIAFGSVEAGVIGMHRPMFEIWGVTPARAEALVDRAGAGAIQVDGEVSAQLAELFAFTPEGEVVVEGMTSPAQAFGVVLADTGVAIAAEPAEDIGGRKDAVAAGDRAEAGGDRYR